MALAAIAPADAAQAIVEAFIRRPIAYVVGDTALLYTGGEGVVTLPRRPVAVLTSVQYMSDLTFAYQPVLIADQIGALSAYEWVTATYDHGWHDADVPAIVRVIAGAVTARLAANADGIKSERIGAYSVDYGASGSAWLTKPEQEALHRFRIRNTTLTMSTPIGGLP